MYRGFHSKYVWTRQKTRSKKEKQIIDLRSASGEVQGRLGKRLQTCQPELCLRVDKLDLILSSLVL